MYFYLKLIMGDKMVFVYIEDYSFLTKIIYYLDMASINYTTDLDSDFSYILFAEVNMKTLKMMDEYPDKKFIFITHIEENKIFHHFTSNNKRSTTIKNKYHSIFKRCYKLIVSLPYFKNLFLNDCHFIDVIPKTLPIINISRSTKDIYEKYELKKRRKKIVIMDINYDYISYLHDLSYRYPKFDFIYIGYKSKYLLTKKEKSLISDMNINVKYIPYVDLNIFSDLCKVSYMVIDFNSYILDRNYLYMILLLKKQLMLYENVLYDDFLIPSKHAYFFKDKDELFLRFDKIIQTRVMNLSENGFDLIKGFSTFDIVKKYSETLQ